MDASGLVKGFGRQQFRGDMFVSDQAGEARFFGQQGHLAQDVAGTDTVNLVSDTVLVGDDDPHRPLTDQKQTVARIALPREILRGGIGPILHV